jgi:hypothetical protein
MAAVRGIISAYCNSVRRRGSGISLDEDAFFRQIEHEAFSSNAAELVDAKGVADLPSAAQRYT